MENVYRYESKSNIVYVKSDHISTIRKQAKALQEEGKAILEQAKKEVEQMILGN